MLIVDRFSYRSARSRPGDGRTVVITVLPPDDQPSISTTSPQRGRIVLIDT
ncbi:hypothetical protein H7X46_09770 [Pseudonocardia sp. C8]|uniref:hypothetical protein n=1 Tax=Pseudonocardia sp. C8 TaxID=2762759 RepID=UPI0016435973|nr:hypothetical protein [Pseudonocardia sp. C8]MBC3191347.1 hypothetical protein [Pseudonocardia sp. C8]